MKNYLLEEIKSDYLESLKTIVSYPSVLNEGENETPLDKLFKMSRKNARDH